MSTTVNIGWLKDNNGNKFAPKTLSSQVINEDGVSIDQVISQISADAEVTQDSIVEALGYTPANQNNLGGLAAKDTVAKTDLATDVQTSLNKADTALQSFTETDPTVPAWAKEPTKPSYTASEVGADVSGTAESFVSSHNSSNTAHEDIREEIGQLSEDIQTLSAKQDEITGIAGDFVVIGADGKVTTKTIAIAEEATF